MKRTISHYLNEWKSSPDRKSLIVRGARQVGKTYTIRKFGQSYDSFVEINFEHKPKLASLFEQDLDAPRIVRSIELALNVKIVPGKTLLFFDEIQKAPQAIIALRYFYELMPQLHVIAAGSLLDFTIEAVGIPVGRVEFLYMYPLSFLEFLDAVGETLVVQEVMKHSLAEAMNEVVHEKLLRLLGQYLAIGGMPSVVAVWSETHDINRCRRIQETIVATYRQDFGNYAKRHQIKYLDLVFDSVPRQIGRRFKYTEIEGEFRKRELAPCLDALTTAGVISKVMYSASQGIPLGAQTKIDMFKTIFIDVGLSQAALGLDVSSWFLEPFETYINKGELVESFVGQELLAYSSPTQRFQLYYWQRTSRGAEAEVDYVCSLNEAVIPIEVKSGAGTGLKSMRMFLESHKDSPYGIRFSTHNYSEVDSIHSYPLYAIAHALNRPVPITTSDE